MAGFKTHLAGGMASGTGLSLIGYHFQGLSLLQAGTIFVVGIVALAITHPGFARLIVLPSLNSNRFFIL